ncbi:MAG: hypothetical protein GOV00_01295 [Candidatus Altiarchaeota archaeon]|nr:hypothetical protein [Candidatus Altiarchaeota archaeon]
MTKELSSGEYAEKPGSYCAFANDINSINILDDGLVNVVKRNGEVEAKPYAHPDLEISDKCYEAMNAPKVIEYKE